MINSDEEKWQDLARGEINSIKQHFVQKYGWEIQAKDADDCIHLFVRMQHSRDSGNIKVLRLTYGPKFPNERPREEFVNPDNYEESGLEYWIEDNTHAFKTNRNPPAICLQGTWGFHHSLHRDRDPLQANINQLLRDVQLCLNKTN